MKTILIVDDQEDVRDVLSFAFRTSGFNVLEAGSAAEALRIHSESSFDVLITDYLMPNKNGIQLVKELRALGFIAPVFIITGYNECPRQELIELKVSATIFKPFDCEEVVTQVRGLVK